MAATGFFVLGLMAWLVAVFGPLLLGLLLWRIATERTKPWLAHLFFLPCVLGIEWVAVRAIFFASHDTGEGPPGSGLLLILPLATSVGSIAFYYLAAAWQMLRRTPARLDP